MKRFELAQRALRDLQEIWEFVSEDSCDAADRLLEEFYRAFQRLQAVTAWRTDASVWEQQEAL